MICNNELKYPIIFKVVKSCFAIAEANAGVERLQPDNTYYSKRAQLVKLGYCERDPLQQRRVS